MANLIITTECNAQCPFCFAREIVHRPVRRMDLTMVERLIRFCAGERKMQLLGGEPTLHPEIGTFVELLSRQPGIETLWVVTNLMGPTPIIESLVERSRCDFLINVHGSEFVKDPELRLRFNTNLAVLRKRHYLCTLGVTLFRQRQNFDYLYSLLRADAGQSVGTVRVSPSVPTLANEFLSGAAIGDQWLELVRQIHRICPEIRIQNDCPVINGCMFTRAAFRELTGGVDRMCMAPCTGLDCPFDILPDGSVRFCFGMTGVAQATLPDVFAYPDIRRARHALHMQMHHWRRTLGFKRCEHTQCRFLDCHGVCPAVLHFFNPAALPSDSHPP